ncbi:hypothetical protein BRETT_001326 [Brettanomyces bruxellensis]|uniref:CCZ1/INTU/HSP4 first Longin domain-containing protein n=1 Tax=Dekkera bruxellensis TaxID=5007 RepID=A0A871RGK9_DEKBR|nr:uncharacterized protein BRETT_001326 [Brettanomyces bruxellensis]QOU21601.1 hypothetical protein BRETT_001326 [Brettanomyces bruxellensis]
MEFPRGILRNIVPGTNGQWTGSTQKQTEQKPSIGHFYIFCTENKTTAEAKEASLISQNVVASVEFNSTDPDENGRSRLLGMVQALSEMTTKFGGSDASQGGENVPDSEQNTMQLSHIDTDGLRELVGRLEDKYYFVCGIKFASYGGKTYKKHGIASPEFLISEIQKGGVLWRLNYGSIGTFLSGDFSKKSPEFAKRVQFLSSWWQEWLNNRFEFPSSFDFNGEGVYSMLNGVKLSSRAVSGKLAARLAQEIKSGFTDQDGMQDVLILNRDRLSANEYGALYVNEDSPFERVSIIGLLDYLQRQDFDFGLSRFALKSKNLLSLQSYRAGLEAINGTGNSPSVMQASEMGVVKDENQSYVESLLIAPFRNAYSTVSSFMPTFGGSAVGTRGSSDQEEQNTQSDTVSSDQKPTGRFLLGKTDEDGGSISTRKIILRRKKGETAGKVEVATELVMYEIGQVAYALLYQEDSPVLAETLYYEKIGKLLDDITEKLLKPVLEEGEKTTQEHSFFYLAYNKENRIYKASLPWIPDTNDVKKYKNRLETLSSPYSRATLVELHVNAMNLLLSESPQRNMKQIERLMRMGDNWWGLLERNGENSLVVLKNCKDKNLTSVERSTLSAFGPEVADWYKEFTL